jgi:DNA-binding transcriptional LysR family regulator
MDYRYLKAFLSVARHLSFSSAAKELCIATSAVSRQVQLFESSIGKELFIRSQQGGTGKNPLQVLRGRRASVD